METLATLLTAVLKGMCLALGPYVNRDSDRKPVLRLAWTRISRAATRFQALFVRWQSNTLPTPSRSRPAQSRPAQPRQRAPKPYFPAGRAWLAGSTDHHVRGRASQLEHLLNHPDMPAFLAAAPQAGRILRPLCHMLGITMPPTLLLSPRARAGGMSREADRRGGLSLPRQPKPPKPKLPPLLPLAPQRRPRPLPFMNFTKKPAPA